MRKFITFLIVFIAVAAGFESYVRFKQRQNLGFGFELRCHQPLFVELCDDLQAAKLREGDQVRFRVTPGGAISSMSIGDGALKDVVLVASVVGAGMSEEIGHPMVLFEFQYMQFRTGRRHAFKGSIHSPDDPAHMKDSGILGSFVGMEFGPVGVVGGFLLGTLAPYYHGRILPAPMNYAIGNLEAGEKVVINVHYADYVPFKISSSPVTNQTKYEMSAAISKAQTQTRKATNAIKP